MDYKEVKKHINNLHRLEDLMAKTERINSNWRNTESGQILLEEYSRAVDKKIEINSLFTQREIVAYALVPDVNYGGSFS